MSYKAFKALQKNIEVKHLEAMTYDQINDAMRGFNDHIERLEARIKELEAAEKKAFWWSAEFTNVVHNNKILDAWEDYKANYNAN